MPLKLMYITNDLSVAKIAEKYGVDRIWIDLETLGKEERQKNMNSVKSHHKISDITKIKPFLSNSKILVRVNPWNADSKNEIDSVIDAGADYIMLPMWKSPEEVRSFLKAVGGRVKTILLLETKDAVDCLDEILCLRGIDEIHVGLNDLHLSYGLHFMFELLANGTVEKLCIKFKKAGIPFGFGGIAKIGEGMLPAEMVIMEHYRLGSTRVILSRSFCDNVAIQNIDELEDIFKLNIHKLRNFEKQLDFIDTNEYVKNKNKVIQIVDNIVKKSKED